MGLSSVRGDKGPETAKLLERGRKSRRKEDKETPPQNQVPNKTRGKMRAGFSPRVGAQSTSGVPLEPITSSSGTVSHGFLPVLTSLASQRRLGNLREILSPKYTTRPFIYERRSAEAGHLSK